MKIEYLRVYTSDLQTQVHFYRDVLGLIIEEVSHKKFRVQTGFSILEFEQRRHATPYHIAFHVPANKEKLALKWLEERLEVLEDRGHKIIDFPAWRARSVYFYDADKNILEFISRKHLFESEDENFSRESILGISEIGLATSDVEDKFNFLNEQFGLSKFTGDYQHFCATGDDEGLFIIINKNQKDWIPTGDKAFSSAFQIRIMIQKTIFRASFNNDSLTIL